MCIGERVVFNCKNNQRRLKKKLFRKMQFSVLKLAIGTITTRGSGVQPLLYITFCLVKPSLVVSFNENNTGYFLNNNWLKIIEVYVLRFYNASSLCTNIVIQLCIERLYIALVSNRLQRHTYILLSYRRGNVFKQLYITFVSHSPKLARLTVETTAGYILTLVKQDLKNCFLQHDQLQIS